MRTKLLFFGFLFLFLGCAKQNHLADVKTRTYRIEKASYPVDVKIAQLIEPYKVELEKTMNEVIGVNEEEMIKGKPNSSLTNWFTDALLTESQKLITDTLDFAIQNYGGIRLNSFAAGEITIGKVYELMPFDNVMFIMELKGSVVKQLFDRIAKSGGWPISHTVSFKIAFGEATDIMIWNKPIDMEKTYHVAIPDYIALGGDNMEFMKDCTGKDTQALVRDLLIQFIRYETSQGRHIVSNPKPRITEI
ncbi:MAG: 5'-nucleotidase C-terminal domain-containing protein [Lewinellaceae bacterium]|nr:5'-nucleotidase C-terminal domain-containing protein [Lewinellaceae bacterium]